MATGGRSGTATTTTTTKAIDHVPSTDFAPLYRSVFTIQSSTNPALSTLLARLQYCNCSYLCTKGYAPTLLQLKQHAQALVILIKNVTVNTIPALIDNVNTRIPGGQNATFNDGETYDFLNDLNKAYDGPNNADYMHHHTMPLHALMNIVEENEDPLTGHLSTINICPMHNAFPSKPNGKSLPYAQHQSLIAHANEILELLDHEYSAKGGILSILPDKNSTDPEIKEQYEKSQTTLLGQMIQQHRRLVMRIHDLERVYSNALDALAGEAAVPSQQLNRLGPDARKGREVVFPQDRFVLANCGEDLWDFLEYEFTKKENSDEAVRLMYKNSGVVGADMWRTKGLKEYERGVTALDITTRYIRLRKDPLKTVFVIPAHEHHPGTKATRDMEKVPTVVSVVKPIWPERQSIMEMKTRDDLQELRQLRINHDRTKHELEVANNAREIVEAASKQYRVLNEELNNKLNNCLKATKPDETAAVKAANEERDAALKANADVVAKAKTQAEQQALIDNGLKALRDGQRALAASQLAFATSRNEAQRQANVTLDAQKAALTALQAQAAQDTRDLQNRLSAVWKTQIEETASILNLLRQRKLNLDVQFAGEDQALADGLVIGTAAFKAAVVAYKVARGLDPAVEQFGLRPLPGSENVQPAQVDDDMGMDVDMAG